MQVKFEICLANCLNSRLQQVCACAVGYCLALGFGNSGTVALCKPNVAKMVLSMA